jgi:hypothetical protein
MRSRPGIGAVSILQALKDFDKLLFKLAFGNSHFIRLYEFL